MSALGKWYRQRPRWWRWLFWVLLAILLYAGIGAWILPRILRSQLEKQLAAKLHRPVRVSDVAFNPFALRLDVNGLSVGEPHGPSPFLSFGRFTADLQAASILRLAPVLKAVELDAPRLTVTRHADGTFNFSDLLGGKAPEPAPPERADKRPFRYRVADIALTNGQVVFVDEATGSRHRVDRIFLHVPLVSNFEKDAGQPMLPDFSARLDGSPLRTGGEAEPFAETRPGQFAVHIRRLDLTRFFAYLPGQPNFSLPSAVFDASLKLRYDAPPGQPANLLLGGNLRLLDVHVLDDRGATFLQIPEVAVELAESQPLANRIRVAQITVREPFLAARRDEGGAFYTPGLSPPASQPPPPAPPEPPSSQPPAPRPALDLLIEELDLLDGTVTFADDHVPGRFEARLGGVCVNVRGFNLGAEPSTFTAGLVTESGEALAVAGDLSLAPLRIAGAVNLARLNPVNYRPYYDALTAADLRAATLSLETCFSVARDGDVTGVALTAGNIAVDGLAVGLKDGGPDLVALRALRVRDAAFDLAARTLAIGGIGLDDGHVDVVRTADGLNLQRLAAPPGAPAKPQAAPAQHAPAAPPPAAPFQFTLGTAEIAEFAIGWRDETVTPPVAVTLKPVGVAVSDFRLTPGHRSGLRLDLALAEGGRLTVSGGLALQPLSADLDLDLNEWNLPPFQPYWQPFANLTVTAAALSTKGHLTLVMPPGGKPAIGFAGDVRLAPFASVDPIYREPFLKWEALAVTGLDAKVADAVAVTIPEVSLTAPAFAIIIGEDKAVNLTAVLKTEKPAPAAQDAPPPDAPPPAGPPPAIALETVRVTDGAFSFLDRSIKPNYAVELSEMAATVSGLAPGGDRTAAIAFQAVLDRQAAVNIAAKVRPDADRTRLFLDTTVGCRGIELPAFTPYSGKYIGYAIEKGKLNLDLTYRIDQGKLAAQNRILFDQFTLGDKSDSPDAPDLPIKLAIALLTDRNAQIKLDVPLQGNLADPEFRILPLVVQVLTNIIVKAATAPFAMLGALAGSDAQLDVVLFAPGQAGLSEPESAKLTLLAQALYDRPALNLEIAGSYDSEADRAALQDARLDREIKAAKIRAVGGGADSTAEVTVTAEEMPTYLSTLYEAAVAANPALRSPQPQPGLEEMRQAARQALAVSDEELKLLAGERARRVSEFLAATGKVESGRLFVTEAAPPAAGGDGPLAAARLAIK